MTSIKNLEEALKELLKDDGKVSKYDAHALRELIVADGRISSEERLFLERAINDNIFDDKALAMLKQLLLRDELKYR